MVVDHIEYSFESKETKPRLGGSIDLPFGSGRH